MSIPLLKQNAGIVSFKALAQTFGHLSNPLMLVTTGLPLQEEGSFSTADMIWSS